MILHRVTLENVGVYRGSHSVELAPPDSDHPITLIGALNGGGKTTLLGAVQLGLYGSRAKGIERTKKGYQRHLQELINRSVPQEEGAAVEIEFERRIDGQPVFYRIRRSWRMKGNSVDETLEALRDGKPDALLADHWDEAIDSFLPSKLSHLFFFDGEQIEKMADEEEATKLLATAFQSLLGLDLVTRLQEDLATLERKKRLSLRSPEEREKLKTLEEEVEKAQLKCEGAHQEFAGVKNQIDQREKSIRELKSEFKAKGGEVYLEHEKLEARRSEISAQLEKAEDEFREVVAGDAPLLLIPNLLQEVLEQAENEETADRAGIIHKAEQERDKKVLKTLQSKLPVDSYEEIKLTLETHSTPTDLFDIPKILNAPEGFIGELKGLISHSLPQARKELEQLGTEIQRLSEERDSIDRLLSAVPDADTLARIQNELLKAEQSLRDLGEERVRKEEAIRIAELEVTVRKRAYLKEYESHVEDSESSEHDQRIVDRIPRVKDTLEKFRQRVVARHIGALEHAIYESFQHLIRKPKLLGSIRISPENFEMTLLDPTGSILPFQILSAGERQLLATSILWGLAKVSGRPVPLIIDTPLGRLDSTHRSHLVEKYFPAASHQVVLLSTDEEIVGDYHQRMKKHVGRQFLLSFDNAAGSSMITSQYFDK
jgi:DNA sulfur modification protein DndD